MIVRFINPVVVVLVLFASGCAGSTSPKIDDAGLDGARVLSFTPPTLVPGSRLVIQGEGFLPPEIGQTTILFRGTLERRPWDAELEATWVDYDRLEIAWNGEFEGEFAGEVWTALDADLDGKRHESSAAAGALTFARTLSPTLDAAGGGVLYLNDPVPIAGSGLLLGGDEGTTIARLDGCFQAEGSRVCAPLPTAEVPVIPDGVDRTTGAFPFAPWIAGLEPGTFQGEVGLVNRHADGVLEPSTRLPLTVDLVPAQIFRFTPGSASLGQIIQIEGGGFVGGAAPGGTYNTSVELEGTFTPTGGSPAAVSATIIPEFVAGPLLRYTLNEEDDVGSRLDLRAVAGQFTGRARPVVRAPGVAAQAGDFTPVTFAIAPVRQVIHLVFLPTYVESLRHFGLRALDARIRDRVLEVARRDYAGVNVDFRTEEPTDFAEFSTVELAGPDPNGVGFLGYDNSPGKDTGNERLYDRIGGVNATTQQDGYHGYGGVFLESFFGFSEYPEGLAEQIDGSDPLFDAIFDPFRPDRGGEPASSVDLVGFEPLSDGDSCPAESGDRAGQVACAVWVLGSMVGTTMTHEVGHSLGLANPFGEGFHDDGDEPNRLMDAGNARTFTERAELLGDGPAMFCDEEFAYLREILPAVTEPPTVTRPRCR